MSDAEAVRKEVKAPFDSLHTEPFRQQAFVFWQSFSWNIIRLVFGPLTNVFVKCQKEMSSHFTLDPFEQNNQWPTLPASLFLASSICLSHTNDANPQVHNKQSCTHTHTHDLPDRCEVEDCCS